MHYEVELGLVMGKNLRDLDEQDEKGAMGAISSKFMWKLNKDCLSTMLHFLQSHKLSNIWAQRF